MAVPEFKFGRGAIPRILLGTVLGVIFGFQAWRLAQYGFPIPMSWHLALWVFLRHVALGFSVGATAASMSWGKRGLGLGALFSLPSAVGLCATGLNWAPRGVALCAGSMGAGVLIAFLTDAIYPPARKAADDSSGASGRPGSSEKPDRPRYRNAIEKRLAEGKGRLEQLDSERVRRSDPAFEQPVEDRIVWRELLELELQDFDDQVSRLHSGAPGPKN